MPSSTSEVKSPRLVLTGSSRYAVASLRLVLNSLPLDAALEVFRFLTPGEQLALSNTIFGRIVTWRKAVKYGRIPPEEIKRIQELIRDHVEAARNPLPR